MQVQDRGAGLGGIDRLGGDLIGRDRQRLRHRRRVDRAGDRAADDDLVRHGRCSPRCVVPDATPLPRRRGGERQRAVRQDYAAGRPGRCHIPPFPGGHHDRAAKLFVRLSSWLRAACRGRSGFHRAPPWIAHKKSKFCRFDRLACGPLSGPRSPVWTAASRLKTAPLAGSASVLKFAAVADGRSKHEAI